MPVDLDDVRDNSVERDENGDLIPETKTFEFKDETKEVRVLPVTGGLGNRIAKHEEGLQELDPKSVAAVISILCPDLRDITADDVEDMPLQYEIGLANAVASQLPDVDVEESGN